MYDDTRIIQVFAFSFLLIITIGIGIIIDNTNWNTQPKTISHGIKIVYKDVSKTISESKCVKKIEALIEFLKEQHSYLEKSKFLDIIIEWFERNFPNSFIVDILKKLRGTNQFECIRLEHSKISYE